MTRWTFVIAYYNEAAFLPATLAALGRQTVPFRLLLVDNGSTDGTAERVRGFAAPGVEVAHLSEPRPGKVHALETALSHVGTEFVAFGDADTFYPPHYLAEAERAFDADQRVVAAMALGLRGRPDAPVQRLRRALYSGIVTRILSHQTHTGGYGQTFRTATLRAAGGFAEHHWRYVLLDHEVMERVLRHGRAVYPFGLWAIPSPRRSDRRRVRWTLFERVVYHLTPRRVQHRFFHRFLGPRLARRDGTHLRLRDQPWEGEA